MTNSTISPNISSHTSTLESERLGDSNLVNAHTCGGDNMLWGNVTPAQLCPWPASGQGLELAGSSGLSGKEVFIIVSTRYETN